MNTNEKLQRIKAECERLLALAKQRTPGFWSLDHCTPYGSTERTYQVEGPPSGGPHEWPDFERKSDAEFVCECAGTAEAGWKATIATIDQYLKSNGLGQGFLYEMICEILTAWEGLV